MRPWRQIDPYAPRPDDEALRRSRRRIRFSPVAVGPAAARLVSTFRSAATSDAAVATFAVRDVDDTGHWFLSRNRFDEYGFAACLLGSEALAEVLPGLVPDEAQGDHGFFDVGPFALTGGVAWRLGFAPSRPCAGSRAEDLAAAFTTEVVDGRFGDARVDRCAMGWSSWFRYACWDDSWLVTDRRHHRVTLLCCTDKE